MGPVPTQHRDALGELRCIQTTAEYTEDGRVNVGEDGGKEKMEKHQHRRRFFDNRLDDKTSQPNNKGMNR
ncbi:hypothetical protein ANN_00898 [Periplaneta americana]|uniref:Uncharacterized protein n=1 Tax=Periplaneta americana TaxID=6978 RepID=A0ABQ8TT65_PERAM|nr:hypothetical protein ANN_00898 [Periplaneta americana]